MLASKKAGRRCENLFFSFSVIVKAAIRRCEIEMCQSSLLTHPNESDDDRSSTPETNIPTKYAEYPSFLLLQLSTSSVNKEVWNIWRPRSKHCLWFQVDSSERWNCIVHWFGKFNLLSIFSSVFLASVCLQFHRFQRHSFTRVQVEISLLLCCSVALYQCWLWLFLIRCWKLKNSFTKWQSPSQNWSVARNNHPFLANWTEWAISSHYLLWLLSSLSVHLSLGSTAPFIRPSASFENSFFLSLHLTMPTVSLSVLPKTQLQKAFSLHAGALSLWHSLPQ